jgi:predicted O-methyltransferase YrrM
MSLDYRPQTITSAQYDEIFERERAQDYPTVTAFEARTGFAIDRDRMEAAARVLSCPFKAAAPNWQHGRVIYAAYRRRLAELEPGSNATAVDIGTAKGYSALCAWWALADAGVDGRLSSVDVLPPLARVRRNTPAEVDALRTLPEILGPWPEASAIVFVESTGIAHLQASSDRVHCAFVDGKHSTDAVRAEWRRLAERQVAGDIAIFDDVQMPAVSAGLKGAESAYMFEAVSLGLVNRAYAVGVRR